MKRLLIENIVLETRDPAIIGVFGIDVALDDSLASQKMTIHNLKVIAGDEVVRIEDNNFVVSLWEI